jgi:hypothetical protein
VRKWWPLVTEVLLVVSFFYLCAAWQPPVPRVEWMKMCQVHQWVEGYRGEPVMQVMIVPCNEWWNFRKSEVSA